MDLTEIGVAAQHQTTGTLAAMVGGLDCGGILADDHA
jgi:hypothetical protein